MPISPNFVKALTFSFGAIIVFYLTRLGMELAGMNGISISSTNSMPRIALNQLVGLAATVTFWVAVMIMTKEKIACFVVIALKTLLYGYSIYLFTNSTNPQATLETIGPINTSINIMAYAIFGLLHFKSTKGIFMIAVWVILFGFSTSPGFNPDNSYFNKFLDLVDLDRMFIIKFELGEGGYRPIDLLRRLNNEMYMLFNLVIFWFVYSLVKAAKSFDLTLRTIQLNTRINQLTFSLIYWPMSVLLFVSTFGIAGLLAVSFQKGFSLDTGFNIVCASFSVFVIGSIYRNFLTDYMVSKGRFPGWLFWLLNVPVLSFPAWIYTFFLPSATQTAYTNSSETPHNQNQSIPTTASTSPNTEQAQNEDQHSDKETTPSYEAPSEYIPTELQLDFKDAGKNNSIKIILILISTGLILWQYKNTSLGYVRPDSGQTESPIMFALITLGLTIWYLYDWKALFILFFLQTFSIIAIAMFQVTSLSTLVAGSGLVNIIVYYSLFHFDHLKLIENPPDEQLPPLH